MTDLQLLKLDLQREYASLDEDRRTPANIARLDALRAELARVDARIEKERVR